MFTDDPYAIVARLMDAVPSGSYLVMAHAASDIAPEACAEMVRRYNQIVLSDDHSPHPGPGSPLLRRPGPAPSPAWIPRSTSGALGPATIDAHLTGALVGYSAVARKP